jgi:FAD/FMN-containing dehydrogenase
LTKRDYLINNIGEINIELMRSIKRAFDPKGILNPGKIFTL